jgi:hypothetical protein
MFVVQILLTRWRKVMSTAEAAAAGSRVIFLCSCSSHLRVNAGNRVQGNLAKHRGFEVESVS